MSLDYLCRWQVQVSVYCAWRIPAHLRCTQCSILLLSDMYLFMADITNPDFLVWSCRTWIGFDINRFCEQQRQPSSGSAWLACPKTVNRAPIALLVFRSIPLLPSWRKLYLRFLMDKQIMNVFFRLTNIIAKVIPISFQLQCIDLINPTF